MSKQVEGSSDRTVQKIQHWTDELMFEEMKETRDSLNEEWIDLFFKDEPTCACLNDITRENYRSITFCKECSHNKISYFCAEEGSMCEKLKQKSHKKINHEPKWVSLEFSKFTDDDIHLLDKSKDQVKKYYKKLLVPNLVEQFENKSSALRFGLELGKIAGLAVHGIKQVLTLETSYAILSKWGFKLSIKTSKELCGETAKKFLKDVLGSTKVVQLVVCTIELGYLFTGWFNGTITAKQFAKKAGKCIMSNVASFYGCLGGMKAGAALGGLIGPWGAFIGGLIGAACGGLLAGYVSDKIYESFIPTEVEDGPADRGKQIKLALQHFGFQPSELKTLDENTVRRRYRMLAKNAHPDAHNKGGTNDKFIALSMHFATLLAYVDGKSKKDKIVEKAERYLAITYKNSGF